MDMQTIEKITRWDDVSQREEFAPGQHEAAAAYITRLVNGYETRDKDGNVVSHGPLVPDSVTVENNLPTDDDGNPYFPEDSLIVVAKFREKVKNGPSLDRALIVTYAPTFEQFMASEVGEAWVRDQVSTGINRRLFQRYTAASKPDKGLTHEQIMEALPTTVDEYATSSRSAGTRVDLGAYSTLRPLVLDKMNQNAAIKRYNFNSELLRKAMQSKAFAETMYPELEAAGVFQKAYNAFRAMGERHNANVKAKRAAGEPLDEKVDVTLDLSIFDSWEADREQRTFTAEAGSLDDLDDLFGGDDDDGDASA